MTKWYSAKEAPDLYEWIVAEWYDGDEKEYKYETDFGTLLQSHIDYTPNGTGHAASRDCIRYWDEEKGAWRQFKAYNFLRVA